MEADPLDCEPKLHELCEHIRLGHRWYKLGIQLKLDATDLDSIYYSNRDDDGKTSAMFALWLRINSAATRRQIINTLYKIKERSVAKEYLNGIKSK